MSINSLTETEVRRAVGRTDAALRDGVALGGGAPPPANNALSLLVKYIPTESVTIYVAAGSAMPALKSVSASINEESVYWFCGLLTPVLFALILIGKRRAAQAATWKNWPWWKNVAATVAFFVWGLAVPGPPDLRGDTSGVVVGVLALLISTLLSILEPIFERPTGADGQPG